MTFSTISFRIQCRIDEWNARAHSLVVLTHGHENALLVAIDPGLRQIVWIAKSTPRCAAYGKTAFVAEDQGELMGELVPLIHDGEVGGASASRAVMRSASAR